MYSKFKLILAIGVLITVFSGCSSLTRPTSQSTTQPTSQPATSTVTDTAPPIMATAALTALTASPTVEPARVPPPGATLTVNGQTQAAEVGSCFCTNGDHQDGYQIVEKPASMSQTDAETLSGEIIDLTIKGPCEIHNSWITFLSL